MKIFNSSILGARREMLNSECMLTQWSIFWLVFVPFFLWSQNCRALECHFMRLKKKCSLNLQNYSLQLLHIILCFLLHVLFKEKPIPLPPAALMKMFPLFPEYCHLLAASERSLLPRWILFLRKGILSLHWLLLLQKSVAPNLFPVSMKLWFRISIQASKLLGICWMIHTGADIYPCVFSPPPTCQRFIPPDKQGTSLALPQTHTCVWIRARDGCSLILKGSLSILGGFFSWR